MKKIVFATGNSGKLREASEILGGAFELVTPAQSGIIEDIPENGTTLRANSLQKAQYIYDHTGGADCFADDTGLEVEILGGAPGVYSARYAGSSKSPDANIDKLLREMELQEAEASFAREFGIDTPHATRRARFRTVVTLILGGEKHFFEGVMEGRITRVRAGNGGFGYDPVFIADEYPDRTVAELDDDAKNAISHRGKALRAMAAFLNSHSA
ncbi:MAG: RdgB/HAM1 family non-canonical purine NTP pyrophosphatase [Candidatus Cryptobacteroides sp.]